MQLSNNKPAQIVIAPNSFKSSLDAFKVAKAIEDGLEKSTLNAICHIFPIADGGDHTLEVFRNWMGGALLDADVRDPLGDVVSAEWLYIEKKQTAVIEMAKASGISRIDEDSLNPLKANTFGTGQLIMEAINHGAKKVILGLGGSATVDGGLGMLQAFGAEIYDQSGRKVETGTNPLLDVYSISLENVDERLREIELQILCDVENPLLGPKGAAHIFGPQKGANPQQVEQLENAMIRFNQIIIEMAGQDHSRMEGAGAAGGVAIPLKAFFNTKLESGVDFLLSNMGFETQIHDADLLITAEGKVDKQTLQGKGPHGVAIKAREYGVPSIILAGKAEDMDELSPGFDAVFPITNGPMSLEDAMKSTAEDLQNTAKQLGNILALSNL